MGMAASQARYLALVARKSNCEYEGQQINQSRLNLANKSANLFNQMLGLHVPIPPTKQDYMKLQYTYKDGNTEHTLTDWHQLSVVDSDGYNYVVDTEYTTKVYTGFQKKKADPQVQFSGSGPNSSTSYTAQIAAIQDALKKISKCKTEYQAAADEYNTLCSKASRLTYFRDSSFNGLTSESISEIPGGYRVSQTGGSSRDYINYNNLDDANKGIVETAIDSLVEFGALDQGFSYEGMYYDTTSKTMVFKPDIESVAEGTISILYAYYPTYDGTNGINGISNTKTAIETAKSTMEDKKSALDKAQDEYDALDVPTYVGNYSLTPISELTDSQLTSITQIIVDMKKNDINTTITRCFDTVSGEYTKDTYSGGIYYYEQGGTTYYVTYYDLADSYVHGTGINNIDNQTKLPVYSVGDIDTTIKNSEKALLETDANGRFTSVRFENDSIVYNLTVTEIEDTVSYEDAMNQYDYNKALYDKRVSDINAQTSLIQREDQDLELRLKQLDTEQNALSTEIDAVSKVVKDNIEKSFKTFGG